MTRVLIVEDDPDIASVLMRGLRAEGFAPDWTADPGAALDMLSLPGFGAAIIDRMLGPENGLDLIQHLRRRGVTLPLIVLSALSRVEDRAEGLAAGADDYVVKPFQFAELTARLRVALLRAEAPRPPAPPRPAPGDAPMRLASLTFDPVRGELTAPGDPPVSLTEREAALMACLLAQAGQVVPRHRLFDQVWGAHDGATENNVDVYLGYLRRKLAQLPGAGVTIRTLRGRGFMLEESA
ncbi:response regulator transcription factor [Paracoccus sp. p4-l81]|uniref:response regulator transcription factor n=1 Tax=unclassified Paracoccus (in: a-proteobacteria) TaxID=2688777 RepID=UPI0035B88D47